MLWLTPLTHQHPFSVHSRATWRPWRRTLATLRTLPPPCSKRSPASVSSASRRRSTAWHRYDGAGIGCGYHDDVVISIVLISFGISSPYKREKLSKNNQAPHMMTDILTHRQTYRETNIHTLKAMTGIPLTSISYTYRNHNTDRQRTAPGPGECQVRICNRAVVLADIRAVRCMGWAQDEGLQYSVYSLLM